MADEKLNVSPEENPQPSLFDTGPADAPAPETPAPEPPAPENIPEQAAVDAPAQDAPAGAPGEVSVSADQIALVNKNWTLKLYFLTYNL